MSRLREAWRHYFDSRYPVVTPTKTELAAIRRGRAEIKAGKFVTFEQVTDELATAYSPDREYVDGVIVERTSVNVLTVWCRPISCLPCASVIQAFTLGRNYVCGP